MNYG
ncbi:hypothetical protein MTR67_036036 [Solanum verrucosum]